MCFLLITMEKKRLFISHLKIVKAIEKNKIMLSIPGYIYRFTHFGQAIMSINTFDWFAGSILGIYKTMEYFTGRKK